MKLYILTLTMKLNFNKIKLVFKLIRLFAADLTVTVCRTTPRMEIGLLGRVCNNAVMQYFLADV